MAMGMSVAVHKKSLPLIGKDLEKAELHLNPMSTSGKTLTS